MSIDLCQFRNSNFCQNLISISLIQINQWLIKRYDIASHLNHPLLCQDEKKRERERYVYRESDEEKKAENQTTVFEKGISNCTTQSHPFLSFDLFMHETHVYK